MSQNHVFLQYFYISASSRARKKLGRLRQPRGGGYKNRSPGGGMFLGSWGGVPQEVPIRAPIYALNDMYKHVHFANLFHGVFVLNMYLSSFGVRSSSKFNFKIKAQIKYGKGSMKMIGFGSLPQLHQLQDCNFYTLQSFYKSFP